MHQAPGEQCWHTRAHMEAGPMAPCCMAWDLVAQLGISLHGSGPCCMAWDPVTWDLAAQLRTTSLCLRAPCRAQDHIACCTLAGW